MELFWKCFKQKIEIKIVSLINNETQIILQEQSPFEGRSNSQDNNLGLMLDKSSPYLSSLIGSDESTYNISSKDIKLYNKKYYSIINSYIVINCSKQLPKHVILFGDNFLKYLIL